MKVLEKKVTLGEMNFKVQTNRDIAVKSFEEFPDLIEYMLNKQGNKKQNETQYFIEAIKNKELGTLFSMNDRIAELIKFALPLMLESAGDDTDPDKIITYAKDNNADELLNSGLLEFLILGFTQREQAKPKIQFSMK